MDGIHMAIKYEIMFLEIRGSVHGRKHFPFSIVSPSGNSLLVYNIHYTITCMDLNFQKQRISIVLT